MAARTPKTAKPASPKPAAPIPQAPAVVSEPAAADAGNGDAATSPGSGGPGEAPAIMPATIEAGGEAPSGLIRVKAKAAGYRRAGLVHDAVWTDHPLEALSPEQVELLLADPHLSVEVV